MYEAIALYTLQGAFVGYTIHDKTKSKLQTTNIYTEQEQDALARRLAEINESVEVKSAWPDPRDPEVVALLADPNFEPLEMAEAQVIDEDTSFLVWLQVPELDEWGNPIPGTSVDGPDVDMEASVIVYKQITAPKRPSDAVERTHHAQEIVARRRVA